MIRHKIDHLLSQALTTLNLPQIPYTVEHPTNEAFGDYAVNLAMILFKQLKKQGNTQYPSPLNLAQSIVEAIPNKDSDFASIAAAAPGFINFTISQTGLINSFNTISTRSDLIQSENSGKTVIVEYSSPNIAKPFTIGHLRSTIIGDAIANIKQSTGWTVLRDNHLGDWGTQFGKLICAIQKNWIPFDQIETSDNAVKLLVDLYVRFHQEAEKDDSLNDEARLWFKKLEDGDPDARQIWQKCIDWSWREFDRIYQLLGITFSHNLNNGRGLGESFFEDKMQPVLDQLETHNLLKTGELGAKVVDFDGKYPPLMILKKDGATLYATRDLATDFYRKQTFNPDLIINEVGSEQSLYFNQLFEIEYRLDWYKPGQRIHVGHGMYRFKDGKMSTRKGNVIWLEDVVSKAIQKAMDIIDSGSDDPVPDKHQLARDIGIGALKWNDLKGEARRDIIFDWDEILSMKGNSGPYVQYTHARASSVLAKVDTLADNIESSSPLNQQETSLLRWLLRFSPLVQEADAAHDPSLIANYLYELCQRFNTFYNQHSILNDPPHRLHRLALTQLTQRTIKTGLSLLGIVAPQKM